MNIKHLIEILDVLIFTQGLIFGTQFILLKNTYRPTLFLGLFLLVTSTAHAPTLFSLLNIKALGENGMSLLIHLLFLSIPLFYLHIRSALKLQRQIKHYTLLIPSGISFLMLFLLVLYNDPSDFLTSNFYAFYFLIGIIFNTFLIIKIIELMCKRIKKVENTFTPLDKKSYIIQFILLLLVITYHPILLKFKDVNLYFNLLINISISISLYWFIFQGFKPRGLVSLLLSNKEYKKKPNVIPTENQTELQETFENIDTFLIQNKEYKNQELTISDVAKAIQIPAVKVSKAVNHVTGLNFKNYINKLRVQKTLQLFEDDSYRNHTIEALGIEAGFKSKSTFYRAFKKEMKCSPMEYKQKLGDTM
ncbi:helix-turn-helix domain-containing protein [Tenacibaculum amylolyticum]|uniref:helix-turn-helix domain-containing protein n=1 Tax=Tenacibaculum amylolyticum TaxID=104269 RepID=UPI003895DC6B